MTPCLRAQRKEISQVRSYIKSGKDLDKAEKIITNALAADTLGMYGKKLHALLFQLLQKQYEQGNEKLYLKEKYDTASIFNITKRMFAVAEKLDTLDAAPDKKGRVHPEYRKRHSADLDMLRPNLYNGGVYFLHKADYKAGYAFFRSYLDCARQPLFSRYVYDSTDTKMASAAYWAAYCGFKLREPDKVLAHYATAMRDTARQRDIIHYAAEAYNQGGDMKNYVEMLNKGFASYPEFPYFFPRLIDYYLRKEKFDTALGIANKALAVDGRCEIFMLAKATVLLAMGDNDGCFAISNSLLSINDTIPEAYFTAATSCLNKILLLEDNVELARKNKAEVLELYRKACPYMEKYRELAPADKAKWAPALYRIYLNLNKGRQFEEIDKIMNAK